MILLALGLLACSTPAPAPVPTAPAAPTHTAVRVALNWLPEPEFGGFYAGVVEGIYSKAGFDVTLIPGGPGAPTLELLSSGQAEAAITSAEDLLLKRANGVVAVGVWPAFQWAPTGLMAHTGQGLTRYEDIHGGRIALEVGGPFQLFLSKKYGWDGKVELVPTSGSVASFLADPTLIQQAYITSEPCAVRAAGSDSVFLKAADAGWNPYGTVLAFADPPPAWAGAFVHATQAAWEAYLADPGPGNTEIGRLNDQMKPDVLSCIDAAQRPFLVGDDGLGVMTAARWDALASAMVGIGVLPVGSTASGAWKVLP